jgi:hypothetical protein
MQTDNLDASPAKLPSAEVHPPQMPLTHDVLLSKEGPL